jgi:ABC-type amino acid transport substrate-binding protein
MRLIGLSSIGLLAALALSAAGCSSSDSSGSTSGSTAEDGGTLSLYERLGGKSGLESFVKTVVETKILTDAELKTFFFAQVATPIPAGSPSATQIVVCFARFVGTALNADTYPGAPVNDPTNTNNPNHTCRDMVKSHRPFLNIGSGNFDKFIGHIATSLMPLVKPTATKAGEITQAEFDALAAALNGTKGDIVSPGAPASGPFVKP